MSGEQRQRQQRTDESALYEVSNVNSPIHQNK